MRFVDFQYVMSSNRMGRYLNSVGGQTKKAMTLYRLNLRLAQEMFTIESCFEVALRNRIDSHYSSIHGSDWIRDAGSSTGMFNNQHCSKTAAIIATAMRNLPAYSHPKLVAAMDFGFWRYMFARHQFFAGGQTLLQIFPSKPISTPTVSYNHGYIFNELEKINELRNRLAHHEPICFANSIHTKDTTYARNNYSKMKTIFQWMDIDEDALLYGLDHIIKVCAEIDAL